MNRENQESLGRCALFTDLQEEELRDLARAARLDERGAGENLFLMGDPADRVYWIESGQIRLSKVTEQGEEVIVAVLGKDNLFAVVAGLRETTYPVSADAMTPSRLLSWGRSDMAALFGRHPELVVNAMEIVAARMRELQDRYHELATLAVPQRLARTLLRLADEHGRPGDQGLLLDLRLTRQDLAELTGTTLYTASRIVSGWSQAGILSSGRRRVEILDLGALEQLARSGPS